ncbi:diuretic hormone 45 isoform X1 [Aricia agestis]|uniref:diuretic hormone 45 isoform X1 n=1 Tax=Aricia agestis TaxID=91739 RepID=UPI001C2036C3|nr:diuretic hormone 45 isoform X1 [Aricia agestis]XP_041973706.1 diuretic hormone 45 isoform X1 [Aricia agestis]
MMWWSVWCFAMVACGARVSCAPAASGLAPIDWREVDEDMYAVAPVGGRVAAPWMYYFGEEPHDSQLVEHYGRARPKRKMPSLSISNPMEVLRQRLMLEVARKQMRQASEQQAFKNRVFLQNVGKRGFWADSDRVSSHYDD